MIRRFLPLLVVAGALVFGAVAGAETINGSLTGSDPLRATTVFDDNIPSACPVAKSPSSLAASSSGWHYDTYTRTNATASPQCVTVTLQVSGTFGGSCGNLFPPPPCAFSEMYSSFNPNISTAGYMGDIGTPVARGGAAGSYSVVVPASSSYTVVVNAYRESQADVDYTLTLSAGPTAVSLRSLRALRTHAGVSIRWSVGAAPATLGFDVFRLAGAHTRARVNGHAIPAASTERASSYSLVDRTAPRAGQLRYEIDAVGLDGRRTLLGVTALAPR